MSFEIYVLDLNLSLNNESLSIDKGRTFSEAYFVPAPTGQHPTDRQDADD